MIAGLESGYAEGRLTRTRGPFMNVKPLLLCSLVTFAAAAAGCFVVSDKPADSAPPPPPSVATAAPTETATAPATTAAPPPDGVKPVLQAAPHSDAGAAGTTGQ